MENGGGRKRWRRSRRASRGVHLYDAFLSYSHEVDGQLAPAIQVGLQRLARPWYQARALRVFRDDTGLSVNPHLWGSIAAAIDQSRYFVLLLSEESAASPWVNREIEHWTKKHPAERILPVLTEGSLVWDETRGDYDPESSSALPPALAGRFAEEPRHLDLRWARDEEHLDLHHARFREAIADLAAPIHGLAKDELESEDVRNLRHNRRLARGAVVSLVLLLVVALVAGGLALVSARRATHEADRAERQATVANARRLAAQAVAGARRAAIPSLLLAVEAHRIQDSAETRSSLLTVLQRTSHLEELVTGFRPDETVSGLSGDGSTLAISDREGGVSVVDLRQRRHRPLLTTGQQGPVRAFFSSSHDILATTSSDTTVRLWDTDTGRALTPPLRDHAYPVHEADFSPDGQRLATIDASGRGVLWEVPSGRLAARVPNVNGGDDIAFSPDGRLLAVAAVPSVVLDVATMEPVLEVAVHRQSQDAAVSFSPDGGLLAVPNWPDHVVEFWDTRSGEMRSKTVAIESATYVNRLAFTPTGKQVIGAMGDGTITRWDVETGAVLGPSVAGHSEAITEVAFTDEDRLVSASATGAARWGSNDTGPLTTRVAVPDKFLLSDVASSPDGRVLAVLDTFGWVTLFDSASLNRLGPRIVAGAYANDGIFPRLAFSPDGRYIAVADRRGGLSAVDVRTRTVRSSRLTVSLDQGANGVEFSPDGRKVVVGTGAGRVVTVDVRSWMVRRRERVHGQLPVLDVDFSGDGALLASGGEDGRVVIEETAHGRRTTVATGGRAHAGNVTLSPDDRLLAAGFGDGTVLLVDTSTRQPEGAPLTGHGGGVTDVEFSPDGLILAVASDGGTVALWDLETRQRIGDDWVGDTRSVNGLDFAPDGRTLVAVGVDSVMMRWQLDPAVWVRSACDLVGRNFTQVEWRQQFGDEPYHRTCDQWPVP